MGIFTENISVIEKINEQSKFLNLFKENLSKHYVTVEQQQNYQIHKIVEIKESGTVIDSFAKRINLSIEELYKEHYTEHNNIRISTGLVRIAYIRDIVRVAKNLLKISPTNTTTQFHYILYHSNYTIEKRAKIEYRLDELLTRHLNDNEFFNKKFIKQTINKYKNIKHHVFIVIASPVAEIGRDHDYDFAIIEPSSYRSIVQIAGRVQRHRHKAVTTANIHILNQNIESMLNSTECPYSDPGFEYEIIFNKIALQLYNKNIKPSFDEYIHKLTAKNSVIKHKESSKQVNSKAPNLWTLEFLSSCYFLKATEELLKDQFVSLVGHIPSVHKLRDHQNTVEGTISFTNNEKVKFEYFYGSKELKCSFFDICKEQIDIADNIDLVDIEDIPAFNNYQNYDSLNTVNLNSNFTYIYSNIFGFYT